MQKIRLMSEELEQTTIADRAEADSPMTVQCGSARSFQRTLSCLRWPEHAEVGGRRGRIVPMLRNMPRIHGLAPWRADAVATNPEREALE